MLIDIKMKKICSGIRSQFTSVAEFEFHRPTHLSPLGIFD